MIQILIFNLFKSRQTVLASMLSAGAGLGESGMVFIPALAVASMPMIINEHNASYLMMPVVLAMAVGSPLVGRLLDKFGSKVMVFFRNLVACYWNGNVKQQSDEHVMGLYYVSGRSRTGTFHSVGCADALHHAQ